MTFAEALVPLYEIRTTKIRQGPVRLVTREDLDQRRGYRSVYGFPPEAVAHVQATRSTAGLKWFPVYSDELLLDFDDNPEAAIRAIKRCRDNNLSFSWWNSGGRSAHLHIQAVPALGQAVPASHKEFVSIEFPGADLAFYHAAGMYRLPGTAHEKNPGQYKELVERWDGRPLDIPLISSPMFKPGAAATGSKDAAELDLILTHMMFQTLSEGEGRNKHAFKMAKLARETGRDFEGALDAVALWSSTCAQPPLDRAELEATVRSAFR